MKKKKQKSILIKLFNKVKTLQWMGVGCIIICFIVFFIPAFTKEDYDPQVELSSTIEKIINKSDLSTFQVIYNGVAEIKDKDDPQEIAYYVAYQSQTKAGFDIQDLKYALDKKQQKIIITIPEITIQEPNVDITKLEYIFYDKSQNKLGTSEEAYKACVADVKRESQKEKAIYDIAKNNAKKLLESLTKPFIQDMEGDYTLVIK